jgi:outer membrane murein-binding lipoprotein Lpp
MMKTAAKLPMFLIDALGAAILGGCVLGCAYLVFMRGDQTALEINELTAQINTASRDLSAVRTARDVQRNILKQQQVEMGAGRQLPASIPLEEYFQALSRLAVQHHLRVVRQNPLSPREYPGLLEQRYAYEVSGSMPDMVRFFKSIEEADFWADIAFLKIDGVEPGPGVASRDRLAILTLSLFSALKQEAPAAGG